MRKGLIYKLFFIVIFTFFLQGCIYENPQASKGPQSGGDGGSYVSTQIEVSYNISWQNLLQEVQFNQSSRARETTGHRFIVEVSRYGERVCRDEIYLSENEFATGVFSHRLSSNLQHRDYDISVWYDKDADDGNRFFDTTDLSEVKLTNLSTTGLESLSCAYASDHLDLSDYEDEILVKEIEMALPGAKFEIVTTDAEQFIAAQKESLNQGDTFTACLDIIDGGSTVFNVYDGVVVYSNNYLQTEGRMRLPFVELDELKIAEGFLFCETEDVAHVRLTVNNSALVPVARTETFSFPVKRGYVTKVVGEFLTTPIDGVFSIDHIWEGEITMEI